MMKTDEISASAEEEFLCEERHELQGVEICYSLRRRDGAYRIRAEYQDDYAWYYLGRNEETARNVFAKLVEGGVTPCTLKYLADELV